MPSGPYTDVESANSSLRVPSRPLLLIAVFPGARSQLQSVASSSLQTPSQPVANTRSRVPDSSPEVSGASATAIPLVSVRSVQISAPLQTTAATSVPVRTVTTTLRIQLQIPSGATAQPPSRMPIRSSATETPNSIPVRRVLYRESSTQTSNEDLPAGAVNEIASSFAASSSFALRSRRGPHRTPRKCFRRTRRLESQKRPSLCRGRRRRHREARRTRVHSRRGGRRRALHLRVNCWPTLW